MSLRANLNGHHIQSYKYSVSKWQELKDSYKSEKLLMPCCDNKAVPKTSSLGTFFFAHARRGDCTASSETETHRQLKILVAQAAEDAGWEVTTEKTGETPDGKEWRADVYCTKGKAKVVFEIQVSRQKHVETHRRQKQYKDSGVRCAWLASRSVFDFNYVGSDKNVPFFLLDIPDDIEKTKVLNFDIDLKPFIEKALNGKLSCKVIESENFETLHYIEDTCRSCKKSIKHIVGITSEWRILPLNKNHAAILLESILKKCGNELLHKYGLNTIAYHGRELGTGLVYSPFVNECYFCQAPLNNRELMRLTKMKKYHIVPIEIEHPIKNQKWQWVLD